MKTHTEEEMTALAAELLEIDLRLPSVCEACGAEKENGCGKTNQKV